MILLLLSFLQLNSAHAQYLPVFHIPTRTEKNEIFPRERVKHFRIQIFPHFGSYSTPQGREATAKTVSITSTAPCTEYQTSLNADYEWTQGNVVRKGALPASFVAGPAKFSYFSCDSDFIVHRDGKLKSLEYTGDFVVVTTPAQVKIINVLEPEDYLKGVIPAEVSSSWPDEVLKTQAIAARTYAWWTVTQTRKGSAQSDMDDTVSFQAYMGETNASPRSDSAADQTAHIVMAYNGEIIKAYFSADSGGYTEDASEVFEPLAYCKANPEKYDVSLYPASMWTRIFTAVELKRVLVAGKFLNASVTIADVIIPESGRTESERVSSVNLIGTDGKTYVVSGSSFRSATKIKSNLFNVTKTEHGFVLDGRGFGHGVGMAQIGALQYVNQFHWTHEQILNFYYTGVNFIHD